MSNVWKQKERKQEKKGKERNVASKTKGSFHRTALGRYCLKTFPWVGAWLKKKILSFFGKWHKVRPRGWDLKPSLWDKNCNGNSNTYLPITLKSRNVQCPAVISKKLSIYMYYRLLSRVSGIVLSMRKMHDWIGNATNSILSVKFKAFAILRRYG